MHMEPIVWARRNVSKNVDPVAFRVTWEETNTTSRDVYRLVAAATVCSSESSLLVLGF